VKNHLCKAEVDPDYPEHSAKYADNSTKQSTNLVLRPCEFVSVPCPIHSLFSGEWVGNHKPQGTKSSGQSTSRSKTYANCISTYERTYAFTAFDGVESGPTVIVDFCDSSSIQTKA
jgi:hypothetical protein